MNNILNKYHINPNYIDLFFRKHYTYNTMIDFIKKYNWNSELNILFQISGIKTEYDYLILKKILNNDIILDIQYTKITPSCYELLLIFLILKKKIKLIRYLQDKIYTYTIIKEKMLNMGQLLSLTLYNYFLK